MANDRVFNFSAGPSMLPLEVLQRAGAEITNYNGSGMSVMEMSHRSKVFQKIFDDTQAKFRKLMNVPEGYKVLFLQGGGTMQFGMVPMNLIGKTGKADYAVTGNFANLAMKEAKKYGDEVGTKNYVYGDKLLEYARAADAAAEKYDIDVLFICPALEVRRVAENTKHLFVLATYMDTLRPGRGCADILPEGLKAAGAVGVMINHCEKPMSLPQMKKTIDRARELDFLVFACADTLDEAKAIAQLHPDIINPEPSEIIGGGKGASPMAYVRDSIKVIKEIDPNIMVEQAAGITCGQEVYDFIMAGSEAAGAASGIMNAADPIAMIDEMIAATRRAADDLKKQEG